MFWARLGFDNPTKYERINYIYTYTSGLVVFSVFFSSEKPMNLGFNWFFVGFFSGFNVFCAYLSIIYPFKR